MKYRNKSAKFAVWCIFSLVTHIVITGLLILITLGIWSLSNSSYEAKWLQYALLCSLSLPILLDPPVILSLCKFPALRSILGIEKKNKGKTQQTTPPTQPNEA
jgi:hypothetical protein